MIITEKQLLIMYDVLKQACKIEPGIAGYKKELLVALLNAIVYQQNDEPINISDRDDLEEEYRQTLMKASKKMQKKIIKGVKEMVDSDSVLKEKEAKIDAAIEDGLKLVNIGQINNPITNAECKIQTIVDAAKERTPISVECKLISD